MLDVAHGAGAEASRQHSSRGMRSAWVRNMALVAYSVVGVPTGQQLDI